MTTEAQIRANRQNCKKSTGPKTVDGKGRSRRNAMKHGFRAESGMATKRVEAKVNAAIDRWRDELRPEGQAEDSLVRLAAWSGAQLEALAEQHAAIVRRQARKAVNRFENKRIDEVESLIAEWEETDDTIPLLDELSKNTAGCGWVVQEWESLIASAQSQKFCGDATERRIVRLLDEVGRTTFQSLATMRASEMANPNALEQLTSFMRLQRDAWSERRKKTWEEMDRPLREEAESSALAPLGRGGDRWLRYQGVHASHLHRSISGLLRIRTYDREPRPNDFQGRGGAPRQERPAPNEADFRAQPLGFQMNSVKRPDSLQPTAGTIPTSVPTVSPIVDEAARLQAEAREIYKASELRRQAERAPKRAPNEADFRSQAFARSRGSVNDSSRLRGVLDQTVKGVLSFLLALVVFRTVFPRYMTFSKPVAIDASAENVKTRDDRNSPTERIFDGRQARQDPRFLVPRRHGLVE
ncbi:MAG: hypothetical protein NVSMB14_02030 [Isosphaeraceae bacterium]